jgi:hypothetical protein
MFEKTFDFLAFKAFLTPSILLVLYYSGAILIPIVAYRLSRKLQERLLGSGWVWTGSWNERLRTAMEQGRIVAFGVSLLLVGELAWRMFFEFFFAYFQIHEALQRIPNAL